MRFSIASVLLLMMAFTASSYSLAADNGFQERNVATVKLYFVNQFFPDAQAKGRTSSGSAGLGSGGMGLAEMTFETADLFLDGKFISNVMFRHVDVTPSLNLPSGDHTFRIECDGYREFEKTLTVLGNGSVQWLVVRLERASDAPVPVNREPATR